MCRVSMLPNMDLNKNPCIDGKKVIVNGMKFIETKKIFFINASLYGEGKRKDLDWVNEFPYLNLEWKDGDC